MKESIAVLGGDLRQVWLARFLLDDGCDVVTWGLEQGDAPNAVPLNQALEARLLILPLPVCRDGKLFLPLTDSRLEAEQLWSRLRYDQLLLGGMTGELSPRLMSDFGLTLLDYYDREEAQVANAVPTALTVGRPAKTSGYTILCQKAAMTSAQSPRWSLACPLFPIPPTNSHCQSCTAAAPSASAPASLRRS